MSTAFLKQIGSDQQIAPLPISASEVTIGRDPSCQLVLDSVSYTMVSRRHASIRPIAGLNSFEICDLGSANGTFINGQRLQGCQRLFSGDRLMFGNNGPEFLFEDSSIPPTVVNNSPAYVAPTQASTPDVGSNQAHPYPAQPANRSRGVSQILGIVAVIVVGGFALQYLMPRTNSGSSKEGTTPSSPSSPQATPKSAGSPEGTTSSSPSSPETAPGTTAEFGNTRACASTPSTRGRICSSDITVFAASSTQEIDIFAAVKNASPDTKFSAVLASQGERGTESKNLGSGPLQSNIAFVYLTPTAQGFPIGNYDLVLSLDSANAQPIHKTFSVN